MSERKNYQTYQKSTAKLQIIILERNYPDNGLQKAHIVKAISSLTFLLFLN
jgi:hypothetical protein